MSSNWDVGTSTGFLLYYFALADGNVSIREKRFIDDLLENTTKFTGVNKGATKSQVEWMMSQFAWMMKGDLMIGNHKKFIHALEQAPKETQLEIAREIIDLCDLDGGINSKQKEMLEYLILYLRLDKEI